MNITDVLHWTVIFRCSFLVCYCAKLLGILYSRLIASGHMGLWANTNCSVEKASLISGKGIGLYWAT